MIMKIQNCLTIQEAVDSLTAIEKQEAIDFVETELETIGLSIEYAVDYIMNNL